MLVHGFTQTAASWADIGRELRRDGHEVITVDVPGHAGSQARSMIDAAGEIADRAGRGIYVGYSMGARLCLHVALERPQAVGSLVVLGATAGIEDWRERNARRHQDELLAVRVEELGVERFVDEWLALPMFANLAPSTADLAGRLTNTPEGLAGALRLAGTGAQEPLWERLREIGERGIPTLVLAGELDGKFKMLARRLTEGIGSSAQLAWVPGAGHAAHLERPTEFLALLREFMSGLSPDRRG